MVTPQVAITLRSAGAEPAATAKATRPAATRPQSVGESITPRVGRSLPSAAARTTLPVAIRPQSVGETVTMRGGRSRPSAGAQTTRQKGIRPQSVEDEGKWSTVTLANPNLSWTAGDIDDQ